MPILLGSSALCDEQSAEGLLCQGLCTLYQAIISFQQLRHIHDYPPTVQLLLRLAWPDPVPFLPCVWPRDCETSWFCGCGCSVVLAFLNDI